MVVPKLKQTEGLLLMRKLQLLSVWMCFSIISTISVSSYASSNNASVSETINSAMLATHVSMEESVKRLPKSQYSTSSTNWPTSHPAGAVFSLVETWSYSYTLYIWVENGDIWIQVPPIDFLCGPGFTIIQDGIQYSATRLLDYSGESKCGEVTDGFIYKLTQYSLFGDPIADLSRFFVLAPSSGPATRLIGFDPSSGDIGTSGSGSSSPQVITGTVNQDLDISVPSLDYTTPFGTLNIWADFQYYGGGPNGEMLWKLKDYGANE